MLIVILAEVVIIFNLGNALLESGKEGDAIIDYSKVI